MKKFARICWYEFVKFIVTVGMYAYFRVKIYGKENIPKKGQFLLLSNHQSYLDPCICTAASRRQLCFLARESLFHNKKFGNLISSLNAIPVRRGEADVAAMKAVIAKLKEGMAVCLYPEGTRTLTGKIAKIKPGFGLLCRRGKAGVVPVAIDGLYENWPKGRKFPKTGKIGIMVGEYYSYEKIREFGEEEFSQMLTNELRVLQNKLRKKMGKQLIDYSE